MVIAAIVGILAIIFIWAAIRLFIGLCLLMLGFLGLMEIKNTVDDVIRDTFK